MPHENAPSSTRTEILDLKTLSAQTKVRMILEIFDLSKDKTGIEARKERFLELLRNYQLALNQASKARVVIGEPKKIIEKTEEDTNVSNKSRREIHDQIMDLISKMAISVGLNSDQRRLVQYLSEERYRVEEMITSYYKSNTESGTQNHQLRQALHGEGWFTSPPGKEND